MLIQELELVVMSVKLIRICDKLDTYENKFIVFKVFVMGASYVSRIRDGSTPRILTSKECICLI